MKHYINFKDGDELDVFKAKRVVGFNSPRRRAKASRIKQGYRQRERAALGRMVEQLVVEELGDNLAYWSAELDKALDEHGRIVDEYTEDERIFERFGDVLDWDYYEMRFGEIRKRIDAANHECYAA